MRPVGRGEPEGPPPSRTAPTPPHIHTHTGQDAARGRVATARAMRVPPHPRTPRTYTFRRSSGSGTKRPRGVGVLDQGGASTCTCKLKLSPCTHTYTFSRSPSPTHWRSSGLGVTWTGYVGAAGVWVLRQCVCVFVHVVGNKRGCVSLSPVACGGGTNQRTSTPSLQAPIPPPTLLCFSNHLGTCQLWTLPPPRASLVAPAAQFYG